MDKFSYEVSSTTADFSAIVTIDNVTYRVFGHVSAIVLWDDSVDGEVTFEADTVQVKLHNFWRALAPVEEGLFYNGLANSMNTLLEDATKELVIANFIPWKR